MPTRQDYEAYFEPRIGREMDDYVTMAELQSEYEKKRNRSYQPSAATSLEERSQMEAMIADMRHRDIEATKEYAKRMLAAQAKGQPVKLPTYNNQEVPVSDLSYVLAESLQHLYSSEDPRAEYYDWVQAQQKIELDINTNGTTDDEIKARNLFIDFLDDRETELKLIIMLYQSTERNGTGYYKEMAQNKLSFLNFKLSELRRLRDRTQATKSKSDEQEHREQQLARTTQHIVGGMAAAAAAQELEQTRQSYLQNQEAGREFDTAADVVLTHYRPVTRSVEDVMRKKERILRNRENMYKVLTAMRYGISKEQLEQQEQQYVEVRPQVRRVNGFDRNVYRQLEYDNGAPA